MFKSKFSSVQREDIVSLSQKSLWTKDGEEGLSYLQEKRKLSEETIRNFNLGYVPLYANHQLSGRVIFPIYDASNHLITISSREVVKHKFYDLPVYWHEKYEKSYYLYGMNRAKEYLRKWKFVVLVEGQFDVLQLHNHGLYNVVGVCGNKLHNIQLATIYRYCKDVIILFDNDENNSGQRASLSIMDRFFVPESSRPDKNSTLWKYERRICQIQLSNSKDPDEFVIKNGINPLKSLIKIKLQSMRENSYD